MSTVSRKDGFSGYIFILFTAIGIFVLLQEKSPGVRSVTAEEAAQIHANDTSVVFLDVRNVDEWRSSSGHLRNALLIPLQELQGRIDSLEPLRDRMLIVYCRSGNRSGKAARLLLDKGFHAVNLRGGIREWNAKKFPVDQESVE